MATEAKNLVDINRRFLVSKKNLEIIARHGFWTSRRSWLAMSAQDKAAFYESRRKFLEALKAMCTDFPEFEDQTSQLTNLQPDGSDHERWSKEQSTEWMHKYMKLQKEYEQIHRALNAMLGGSLDVSQPYHIRL